MLVLARAKYVLLTTYKRDGTAVPTPVWAVLVGDELQVWTNPAAGKVKRIRRDGHVEIGPCTQRGKPIGRPISAHARILPDTEVDEVMKALVGKYGWQARLTAIPNKLNHLLGRPSLPRGGIGISLGE
jgi:uncharacterized protein